MNILEIIIFQNQVKLNLVNDIFMFLMIINLIYKLSLKIHNIQPLLDEHE
jgi:hypothetical protein